MNRVARTLPAALAALAVVLAVGPRVEAGDRDHEARELLARAALHARERSYAGTIRVQWEAADGTESERVYVRNIDGVMHVDGARDVIAADSARFVETGGGWTSIGGAPADGELPDATEQWRFRVSAGARIAGRATDLVEVIDRDTDLVRQRVYLDVTQPFALRRETLDETGDVYRVVEFVGFRALGDAGTGSARPPAPPDHYDAKEPAALADLPADVPEEAGGAYRLVSAYQLDDGVAQLFYSDGLFSVSVFVDEGDLDVDVLPPESATRDVEGEDVRAYATPVGDVLVWEDGDDRVLAWVSDAPPGELASVAASFTADDDPGLWGRAADVVLSPFAWG